MRDKPLAETHVNQPGELLTVPIEVQISVSAYVKLGEPALLEEIATLLHTINHVQELQQAATHHPGGDPLTDLTDLAGTLERLSIEILARTETGNPELLADPAVAHIATTMAALGLGMGEPSLVCRGQALTILHKATGVAGVDLLSDLARVVRGCQRHDLLHTLGALRGALHRLLLVDDQPPSTTQAHDLLAASIVLSRALPGERDVDTSLHTEAERHLAAEFHAEQLADLYRDLMDLPAEESGLNPRERKLAALKAAMFYKDGGSTPRYLDMINAAALLELNDGEHEEAEELFSLAFTTARSDAHLPQQVGAVIGLVSLYGGSGQNHRAEDLLITTIAENPVHTLDTALDKRAYALALTELSRLHRANGKIGPAEKLEAEAAAVLRGT